jgi:hypothetical protein
MNAFADRHHEPEEERDKERSSQRQMQTFIRKTEGRKEREVRGR